MHRTAESLALRWEKEAHIRACELRYEAQCAAKSVTRLFRPRRCSRPSATTSTAQSPKGSRRPEVMEPPPAHASLTAAELKLEFLVRVDELLRDTRRRAGHDVLPPGSVQSLTLEGFVDLATECGFVPVEIPLVPVGEVREFAADVSSEERSLESLSRWRQFRDVRRILQAVGPDRELER